MTIAAEISASVASFQISEAALVELLTGPQGAVMADLGRRAIRVEAAAKEYATGRPGPMVRTGRLRGSITWRLGFDEFGAYADIGSNVAYSAFVELGTSRAPAYPYLRPSLAHAA